MQAVAPTVLGGPDTSDLIGQAVQDKDNRKRDMMARIFVDVQFDGDKTVAESVAVALDKVVSNGLAVLLDCWSDYGGEPKVGEFFVLDVETARQHADDLDALIDGKDEDDLGEMLVPVRDFLRQVAGEK